MFLVVDFSVWRHFFSSDLNRNVRRALSEDLKAGLGSILSPYRILNTIIARISAPSWGIPAWFLKLNGD